LLERGKWFISFNVVLENIFCAGILLIKLDFLCLFAMGRFEGGEGNNSSLELIDVQVNGRVRFYAVSGGRRVHVSPIESSKGSVEVLLPSV